MSYEYYGEWTNVTGHHSSLFCHDADKGEKRTYNAVGFDLSELVVHYGLFAYEDEAEEQQIQNSASLGDRGRRLSSCHI